MLSLPIMAWASFETSRWSAMVRDAFVVGSKSKRWPLDGVVDAVFFIACKWPANVTDSQFYGVITIFYSVKWYEQLVICKFLLVWIWLWIFSKSWNVALNTIEGHYFLRNFRNYKVMLLPKSGIAFYRSDTYAYG